MTTIWDNLRTEIEKVVNRDGIDPASVQPGEIESDVVKDAVDNIYYDVAEFYAWYFDPNDDRNNDSAPTDQPVNDSLITAVRATVTDNLAAMKDAGEIPAGIEPDVNATVRNLTGYIVNWQNWYYDRKKLDAWDDYYERQSDWEDLQEASDYDPEIGGIFNDEDVPYIDD